MWHILLDTSFALETVEPNGKILCSDLAHGLDCDEAFIPSLVELTARCAGLLLGVIGMLFSVLALLWPELR